MLGLRTIKQRILYNDYATIIFNVPLGVGTGLAMGLAMIYRAPPTNVWKTSAREAMIVLGF